MFGVSNLRQGSEQMVSGLVSIITPCYNGAKYISETIESVIAQTYKDWEMIIVDDGSVDNSAEIVSRYASTEPKIRYFRQENAGSAAARNAGIRMAEGQYIALLDADDVWMPSFLEKQIAFMKANDTVCVCGSYIRIDENSNEIMKPTIAKRNLTVSDMKVRNYVGCLTGLYDCSEYGKIYLREELKSLRDDYAFWYDIVALENKACGNPEILAKYRVLQSSTTGNKKKLIKKQYKFYRTYLKENPVTACVNLFRWGLEGLIKFS